VQRGVADACRRRACADDYKWSGDTESSSSTSSEQGTKLELGRWSTTESSDAITVGTFTTDFADYTEARFTRQRLWNQLAPLAVHSHINHIQPGLQGPSLAQALSAHCTINGVAAPTDILEDITIANCAANNTAVDVTTSDATDDSAKACIVNVVCSDLALNSAPTTTNDLHFSVHNMGRLIFGGYACVDSALQYCDVEHKRVVASPDASGCVASKGYYWADAQGNTVDKTGMAMGQKCNAVGSAMSAPIGQAVCQCLTGYAGNSCESCAPGFLATPILLGDGVHSLGAVAMLDVDSSGSDDDYLMRDYNQPQQFDYTSGVLCSLTCVAL
jgi:hypothetical protein